MNSTVLQLKDVTVDVKSKKPSKKSKLVPKDKKTAADGMNRQSNRLKKMEMKKNKKKQRRAGKVSFLFKI